MKITFITYHNWETKRIGGFHKLAESALKAGHEVVFFSFSRPYYIRWKKDERLNRQVLKKLSKGKFYIVDGKYKLLNITLPTFYLPGPLRNFFPQKLVNWLRHCSLTSPSKFFKSNLSHSDVFVYESCDAIHLFDKLKKFAPKALHVYRPSDPMMIEGSDESIFREESKILLNSDINFIVNNAGYELYSTKVHGFKDGAKCIILPNGVDTDRFKRSYRIPTILQNEKTALYVGVYGVEWPLVFKAANELPDIKFVIICPNTTLPENVSCPKNLTFIPGISPSEVPSYVTNCNVVIVPNPTNTYKIRPWGITAKYYQAMTAHKPIVAYSDTSELSKCGVKVAYDYDSFVDYLRESFKGPTKINYNYSPMDWTQVGNLFLSQLEKLKKEKCLS